MSGTAQTEVALLAEFPTVGPPGGITPIQLQNFIASTVYPNTARQVFRPDFPPYNIDFTGNTGAATTNTTAWVAMFAAITTAGGGEVIMPQGICYVNAASLVIPNYTYMHGQGFGNSGNAGGTIIRRAAGSAGVVLNTAGTSDSLETISVWLEDFAVEGDGATTAGALIQWLYGSKCYTKHVRAYSARDSGFLIVATQDSIWDENFVNWCGQGGTASSGSTIGQSAVLVSGGTAASGVGASSNGCNNLTFFAMRVETFAAEGMAVQKNLSTASVACSQIRVICSKFETTILGGTAGSNANIISMSNDVRSVWFDKCYFAMDAATFNIGFIDIFSMIGYADLVLKDSKFWVGTTAQVKSIVTYAPGLPSTCWIDHLILDGVTGQLYGENGGAMINNTNPGGGYVPYNFVYCIQTSTGATFSSAYPPVFNQQQTTQSVTGTGQTIAVGIYGSVIITTTIGASMTGMVLAAGVIPGQLFTIINTTAFTIVFAASGTSHVFGTPTQAANVAQDYVWDGTNSLWRQKA